MAKKKNIELTIGQVQDNVLRENFQKIQDQFNDKSPLLGFVFVKVNVTANESNIKIGHGLGYIPKDVILTRLLAPNAASLILNFDLFDEQNLDVTVIGLSTHQALAARLLVGTFQENERDDLPLNVVGTQTLQG